MHPGWKGILLGDRVLPHWRGASNVGVVRRDARGYYLRSPQIDGAQEAAHGVLMNLPPLAPVEHRLVAEHRVSELAGKRLRPKCIESWNDELSDPILVVSELFQNPMGEEARRLGAPHLPSDLELGAADSMLDQIISP
jgi:hypothetical protein